VTSYTLFRQSGGGALDSSTGGYTLGTRFSVSTTATLAAVWHYSQASDVSLPGIAAVWNQGTTTVVASTSTPSWSGAAGSGWVRCPLSASLAAGNYVVSTTGKNDGQTWYSITFSDPGAITNGPLSCPDQPCYYDGTGDGVLRYPASAFGADNIWVDVEISVAAASASGLLMAGIT